jgi:hypothetical protein
MRALSLDDYFLLVKTGRPALADRRPLPFRFQSHHSCISLGWATS